MPHLVDAIPEGSVLVHIGPHKTGTTAIQGMLAAAREDMAALGVSYPGRAHHHQQARALRREAERGPHGTGSMPSERIWTTFVDEIAAHPGRVVISSEILAQSSPEHRKQLVDDLGPERVQLLIGARNPSSMALSTWQQVVRNGNARTLDYWLDNGFRREAPGPATAGFWSFADPASLVEAWSQVVDIDRMRVVVIDERDRALVPSTFEQLLGLPDGMLSTRAPHMSNRSLTAPEVELLRLAIAETTDDLTWEQYSLFFRTGFTRGLHRHRVPPKDEAKPKMPAWATEQAAREAESSIERLQASGVALIGDIESLRRLPPSGEADPIEEIPAELAATAIAGVVTAALERIQRLEGRLEKPSARTLESVPTQEVAVLLRDRVRARLGRSLRSARRRRR